MLGHVWLYENANEIRLFTAGIGDLHLRVTFSRRDATLCERRIGIELSYGAPDLCFFFFLSSFGFLSLFCFFSRVSPRPRNYRDVEALVDRASRLTTGASLVPAATPRKLRERREREREASESRLGIQRTRQAKLSSQDLVKTDTRGQDASLSYRHCRTRVSSL